MLLLLGGATFSADAQAPGTITYEVYLNHTQIGAGLIIGTYSIYNDGNSIYDIEVYMPPSDPTLTIYYKTGAATYEFVEAVEDLDCGCIVAEFYRERPSHSRETLIMKLY